MSFSRTLIPALTSLWLIAVTTCGGGEQALPEDEALDRSVASIEDVRSVLIRMIIQSEYASPYGNTTEHISTDVGYESDQVMFVHTVFGGELADDLNESLYIGDDYYLRPHGENWFVISPSQGLGDPNLPDIGLGGLLETYVNEIVPDIDNLERSGKDSILGETFYRYDGTYDPAFGPPGQATVWLQRENYLPRKVQLSAEERGDAFSLTLEFLDYDLPVALPDVPEARPWRDYELPDAPCSGDDLDGCLAPQEALTDKTAQWCEVEVCFVALGQVEARLMEDLVTHFEDVYGLSVAVLGPSDVAPYLVAPLRGQIDASELIDSMLRNHGPVWDGAHHTIIGITPVDLYNSDEHLSFIFGSKTTLSDARGIISTFRMDPRTYGQPADYNVLLARVRKMATKYVGLLHYGLAENANPSSQMYRAISGVADLDAMTDAPLLVSTN